MGLPAAKASANRSSHRVVHRSRAVAWVASSLRPGAGEVWAGGRGATADRTSRVPGAASRDGRDPAQPGLPRFRGLGQKTGPGQGAAGGLQDALVVWLGRGRDWGSRGDQAGRSAQASRTLRLSSEFPRPPAGADAGQRARLGGVAPRRSAVGRQGQDEAGTARQASPIRKAWSAGQSLHPLTRRQAARGSP